MRMDRTEYDYNPSYREGYDDGYDDGYRAACLTWQEECQKLRDVLREMLSGTIEHGEAPAHDMQG